MEVHVCSHKRERERERESAFPRHVGKVPSRLREFGSSVLFLLGHGCLGRLSSGNAVLLVLLVRHTVADFDLPGLLNNQQQQPLGGPEYL